eukprot:TRINITY_DN7744_c0_g1_i1.p1 TRINITY_DN7744_c0_g1~~TRINITY_DN7744_c0_g1_i1.p1  ORF type:complete len:242 (-),score=67.64 TRINITY_DN7744_c0_g1_i1:269-994(-)
MVTCRNEILAIFRRFDSDGNGLISRRELANTLKELQPSVFSNESNVDTLLRQVDKNKDGAIDYAEFVEWVTNGDQLTVRILGADPKVRDTTHKDPIGYMFRLIDRNEDGVVDEDEWGVWLEALLKDKPELEDHLDFETIVDEDESGTIDKERWKKFFTSMHEEAGEEIADITFQFGVFAAKVIAVQADFPDAPEEAIREALRKKLGSTTSASTWLSHCRKRGRWDCDEGDEDEDEDEDEEA